MEAIYYAVSLIAAVSIASERLVEIVKTLVGWLDRKNPNSDMERLRRLALTLLAMIAGIFTSWLASFVVTIGEPGKSYALSILGLGLLASGGSSFWNSVLTYVLKVKDIKKQVADSQAKQLAGA
ncbi:MAG: hypothetical protein JNK67_13030 [Alphaproteobacteria bacterium]|nr:hypothetical protein [Alphaproteobacteria bacterium]